VLAEVSDDTVSVLADRKVRSTFREIEVERKEGRPRLLRTVGRILEEAGAVEGEFTPKHVRALGAEAAAAPDLVPPGEGPGRLAPAADVVTHALRADIARMLDHDPLVRLRTIFPNGDTAVHQMRVGVRRMRGDLRTFAPVLGAWAVPLRTDLTWVGEVLGAARDAEVLRARLRRTASADPACPLDPAAVDFIDAALHARHEAALAGLADAMDSIRYRRLVDSLVAIAAEPRLAKADQSPADEVLPRLVAREWHRLADGSRGVPGAGFLDRSGDDTEWHEVRKRTKRARYAAEVAATAVGAPAADLALALAAASDALGAHQDAAVAGETWLAIAETRPDDHCLAITAGRLFERERAAVAAARQAFPTLWADADHEGVTGWLR
jgi:CHAD domain-containing protein